MFDYASRAWTVLDDEYVMLITEVTIDVQDFIDSVPVQAAVDKLNQIRQIETPYCTRYVITAATGTAGELYQTKEHRQKRW